MGRFLVSSAVVTCASVVCGAAEATALYREGQLVGLEDTWWGLMAHSADGQQMLLGAVDVNMQADVAR
jgi:hypothetical protein